MVLIICTKNESNMANRYWYGSRRTISEAGRNVRRQNYIPPTSSGDNKRLVLHVLLGCGSLSITPVPLLANEFDVLSMLHGQVSLAAVNQIFDIHGAMKGCKCLKIH